MGRSACDSYHAHLGFMPVPEDVGLDDVEAAFLGPGDEVGPLVGRAARVVDGAGEEELPPAVDHERPAVVRDDAAGLGQLVGVPAARRERGDGERRDGGGEPDAEEGHDGWIVRGS